MDTKNVIAAITLSAAIIILWSLFMIPEQEPKKKDLSEKNKIEQNKIEPVYEVMEGWSESTVGARSWVDLPAKAIKYVRRIEELIEAPVSMLSTSPERKDTILVRDPFSD